uniref:Uncharacterized protein n=1 Tax=Rhizophagus irregularis (strain DAOM 181602 / DAOM 197198 / MUCL 43194) TaxID=747089 RepID=U9SUK7_RHIID
MHIRLKFQSDRKVDGENYQPHNTHVIIQPIERWNNEELQRLFTLALKVIVCLNLPVDSHGYFKTAIMKKSLEVAPLILYFVYDHALQIFLNDFFVQGKMFFA